MLDNILIVGANRGIGLGLIKEILNKNSTANIFATYRDKNKSTELINLSKKHQNLKLVTLEIRVLSHLLKSIRIFDILKEMIDVNNAESRPKINEVFQES
ncbi:hypothetical protein [Candidatus Aquarickettsia rohweri]|uniref:SDR family NAD(P)-dependent oxidoreductase n=1 Tax=Candidatus Aquarickettsia rohweri TaxID=2602574 RepID=A0A429XEP8_9RICK|nr:hypothetical protein [Candidatus Aquarickettsia rohweri]RST62458.1 hypothetical protein EIC27_06315 [Candidatus Aquarickettsia rohweri]